MFGGSQTQKVPLTKHEKNDKNYISLARPTVLLSVAQNTGLEAMGKEIESKLIKVIDDSKWPC